MANRFSLSPPAPLPDWQRKPSQAGIPLLAPWANRLDADAYWANGKRYLLNPEAAEIRRDPNGLPIHGLLLFASAWQVARLHADEQVAEVTSRLEFWKHPEWMAQFPFAHTIELTHRLSGGVLEVRTAIQNHSTDSDAAGHRVSSLVSDPRDTARSVEGAPAGARALRAFAQGDSDRRNQTNGSAGSHSAGRTPVG